MSERKPKSGKGGASKDRGKMKPIIVEESAWMNTGTIYGAQLEEVTAIMNSEERLRELIKGATTASSSRSFLVSVPTAGMRFIFKVTPRDYRLFQLFAAQGFERLDVKMFPGERPRPNEWPGSIIASENQ